MRELVENEISVVNGGVSSIEAFLESSYAPLEVYACAAIGSTVALYLINSTQNTMYGILFIACVGMSSTFAYGYKVLGIDS